MACGCSGGRGSNAGKTAAELNDPNGTWIVRAPDNSETRFTDYNAARRFARRVGGSVTS